MHEHRDTRRTCTTCRHYRPGWCVNAILAQLSKRQQRAEVGTDLLQQHQNCNGYGEKQK